MRRIFKTVLVLIALWSFPSHAETYRLVTAPFKPFTDPDHVKGGFLVEVARQALATRGHTLKIDYKPWPRALAEAQNGRYDGLLSAFYNNERGKVFHFSAPLNTTKMVFVGMREKFSKNRFRNLTEMTPYRIAIGRKWAYSEEFENDSSLNKIEVNDEPSGIRMLFNKRVDLFAVNVDQFHHAIAKMPDYDVMLSQVFEPSISTNDQHIAASINMPGTAAFLAEFNSGLAELKANGAYNAIRNQFFGF